MMSNLKDKIIVVTGGSGQLGIAMVNDLMVKGAIAINFEINQSDDLIQGVIQCDVTSEVSVKRALDLILEKYGRIDGWVNNAYPRTADWGNRFEEISVEKSISVCSYFAGSVLMVLDRVYLPHQSHSIHSTSDPSL